MRKIKTRPRTYLAKNITPSSVKRRSEEIFPLYKETNKSSESNTKFIITILISLNSGGIIFISKFGIHNFITSIVFFALSLIILVTLLTVAYVSSYTTSFNILYYITRKSKRFDLFLAKILKIDMTPSYEKITEWVIKQIITSCRIKYTAFTLSTILLVQA